MLKTKDENKEDREARWKDEEIEILIALCVEMGDDFEKNSKKQDKILMLCCFPYKKAYSMHNCILCYGSYKFEQTIYEGSSEFLVVIYKIIFFVPPKSSVLVRV